MQQASMQGQQASNPANKQASTKGQRNHPKPPERVGGTPEPQKDGEHVGLGKYATLVDIERLGLRNARLSHSFFVGLRRHANHEALVEI